MESSGGYAAPPPSSDTTWILPSTYSTTTTILRAATDILSAGTALNTIHLLHPSSMDISQPTPVPDYYSDPATGKSDVDYYDEAPAPAENYSQAPRSRQAYANTSQRGVQSYSVTSFWFELFSSR